MKPLLKSDTTKLKPLNLMLPKEIKDQMLDLHLKGKGRVAICKKLSLEDNIYFYAVVKKLKFDREIVELFEGKGKKSLGLENRCSRFSAISRLLEQSSKRTHSAHFSR